MKYKCKYCNLIYSGIISDDYWQCSDCAGINNTKESVK